MDASRARVRFPFTVRPFVRVAWGDRLPLQRTFPLGGAEGFPGLRITEWRGERVGMGGVAGQWALLGPVSAELELAGGTVGKPRAGALLRTALDPEQARVIWGGRLGVRIDTPAGAIRVAEGVNSLGRHALFLRLGRWY